MRQRDGWMRVADNRGAPWTPSLSSGPSHPVLLLVVAGSKTKGEGASGGEGGFGFPSVEGDAEAGEALFDEIQCGGDFVTVG